MNKGTENIDMRFEVWKLFVLAALFSISMVFVPPLGLLINSFTPFPLIIIYYLFGRRAGLLASGAILLLLTLVVGKEFGILFVVQYALMALLVGDLARRGYEWNLVIIAGTIVPLLAGGILLAIYSAGLEHSLITSLQTMVADNVRNTFKMYADIGVSFDRQMVGEEEIAAISKTMVMIIPAILTVGAIMSVVINSLVAHYLAAKRYGATIFSGMDVSLWGVPDNLVWVIIGGGVLMFSSSGVADIIGLNVLIVMSVLYFLQGVSVTIFLFKKWRLHMLVKIAIYGIILSQPIFWVLVTVFGLADIWVDFRKMRGKLGAA